MYQSLPWCCKNTNGGSHVVSCLSQLGRVVSQVSSSVLLVGSAVSQVWSDVSNVSGGVAELSMVDLMSAVVYRS